MGGKTRSSLLTKYQKVSLISLMEVQCVGCNWDECHEWELENKTWDIRKIFIRVHLKTWKQSCASFLMWHFWQFIQSLQTHFSSSNIGTVKLNISPGSVKSVGVFYLEEWDQWNCLTWKCEVRGLRCIVISNASFKAATTFRNIDLYKNLLISWVPVSMTAFTDNTSFEYFSY